MQRFYCRHRSITRRMTAGLLATPQVYMINSRSVHSLRSFNDMAPRHHPAERLCRGRIRQRTQRSFCAQENTGRKHKLAGITPRGACETPPPTVTKSHGKEIPSLAKSSCYQTPHKWDHRRHENGLRLQNGDKNTPQLDPHGTESPSESRSLRYFTHGATLGHGYTVVGRKQNPSSTKLDPFPSYLVFFLHH